jgi:phenylacetate-CoA ligase
MPLIVTSNPDAAKHRIVSIAKRFSIRGTVPDADIDSQSLGDVLNSFPVCGKAELAAYAKHATADFLEHGVLFSETSGTTSAPLQTPRGMRDLKWNTLNLIFAFKQQLQPGIDQIAILHPSVLSPFVEASVRALQELGIGYIRVYPIPDVCDYQRMFDVFERFGITAIMSTPTLTYKVLFELRSAGHGKLPKRLEKLLLTGEFFSQESAANLRRILGPGGRAVPFVYGSSEAATLMHGRPDGTYRAIGEDFVFEIHPAPEKLAGSDAADKSSICGRLIVTWLRDGLLPILRYDTNDIFTVSRHAESGEFVFHFEGRHSSYPLSLAQRNAVEATLFNLATPVYHFECTAVEETGMLNIELIAGNKERVFLSEVRENLSRKLGAKWKINLDVNPPGSSFYRFSPTPKTNRFLTR